MKEIDSKEIKDPKFIIHTLGQFDVIKDGRSLVLSSSGSKRIWELYKFMLTYKDKSFTPETLMDQLWIAADYSNPRSTLRRQMYRLRKALREENSNEKTLLFSNGYYKWNNKIKIQIDVDLFEEYIKEGDTLKNTYPKESLDAYKNALNLYLGDYLPECSEQHWIFSVRYYYKRLYLKAVLNSIDLLKKEEDYNEIFEISRKAIRVDIYEEAFHINLLEALIVKGEYRQAFEHYKHITDFLNQEMGVRPSDELREIYKRLLQSQSTIVSKENLHEALELNEVIKNAFYCEPKVFKYIYELEQRRIQRTKKEFTISVLSAVAQRGATYSQNELRMNKFKQFLLKQLRKGDVFTRWNDYQFVILFPGINEELAEKVLKRILGNEANSDAFVISQILHLTSDNILTSENILKNK